MATGPVNITAVRRILVGWDCSPGAAAALQAAAALAADGTAAIVALAVLKPPESTAEGDERRHAAETTFAKVRGELPRDVQERVSLRFAESGDPAGTVCEYAWEQAFDLLALGRHGSGGYLHPRLGHVAATAARKSTVPVLLAP